MKIIDRSVGSGILFTTFFGVVVLSLVLVLGNIFKELLDILINNPDVPVSTLLAFMALVLPFSLTFTIPWGFLTALLLVFGRMSADNELVALKSNGVSVPRTCAPAFFLAVALTLICFLINIEIAPRAEQAMTRAVMDIATSNPASLFRADEIVDKFPDRRVYVERKEGDKLFNIIVFELDEAFVPKQMIFAHEGVLTPDPANSRLLFRLFNARFEQRDEKDPRDVSKIQQGIVMDEGVFPISLEKFFEEYHGTRRMSSYTLSELSDFLAKGAGDRHTEAMVEFNKRFSVSLACAAFVLIAIPLGVTTHRKETSVGFALSLIIAFTYFFFIIMADTFRNNPAAYPSVLIWIPNILFFGLGSFLFARLAKH